MQICKGGCGRRISDNRKTGYCEWCYRINWKKLKKARKEDKINKMETTESSKQPKLDSWDDFAGDYIKAEYVKEYPAKLVVIGVNSKFEEGRPKLICDVEYNGRTWKFDLNKTNQAEVKKTDLMPLELIGKVFVVQKIKVRNPSTNSMVDSLIIEEVLI